ncbi:MAG TPA: fused MFS/spermidine synthase [Pyrinomonadaceae bacterium]|nr:fused MFS/spermidine synthase [Pyrinomonadaceae bacterium]
MKFGFIQRYVLELTVFVCGAVVMTYEIIGSRVVSPFIGTSTYVWTSLIGVILGSLSLGYWLGGAVADKRPDVKILALVIFLAGGAVSVTILIKDVILTMVASAPTGLEIKSVLAAVLLFAPASIALGFVTPYAIRLKMKAVSESGKTVGRLYALSTIGSIVGTFAAGFFLIPFVGTNRTLYLIAASLIILSLLLAPFALSRLSFAVIVVFVLGVAGSELTTFHQLRANGLRDLDTEYSRVQIFRATDPKSARPIQAMATDPYFVQSVIYLDGDELFAKYNRYYHLLRHLRPEFHTTLMIGGAGYTFPRNYLQRYPDASMDVVEIDPQMTAIAHEYFRLNDDPRLRTIHEDGRVFLNRAGTATYNAVLMDAFGSLFSVPYQLTTIEAVRNVSRVLDDQGVVIFNLGSAIRGDSNRFLQAELATYAAVFRSVHLFKVNTDYTDEQTQNLMIVACKTDCLDSAATSADREIADLLSHRYAGELPLRIPVLTDDLAPVEYYNSFAQNLYHR